jgi:hypothetical protein
VASPDHRFVASSYLTCEMRSRRSRHLLPFHGGRANILLVADLYVSRGGSLRTPIGPNSIIVAPFGYLMIRMGKEYVMCDELTVRSDNTPSLRRQESSAP